MQNEFTSYDQGILTRFNLDRVALMARELVERWGLVAGVRGNDDTSGRATLDLLSPQDTVDRAFTIATLFWARVDAEGRAKDLGPLADRKFLMASYDSYRITPVKERETADKMP